jgi:superfamily II DNA or RNA helicase
MKTRESDHTISGGFLCLDMGLGKTRITATLIRDNLLPRTLVLTTKSTVGGWLAELRLQSNFAFDCIEYIKNKTHLTPGRPTAVVATHHSVLKENVGWFREQAFDRVVVDEVHVIRNLGTIFWALREIPARTRWGLTATPFNNSKSDIRAYTEFLQPGLPAEEFKKYRYRKLRSEVVMGGPELQADKHVYDFESPEEHRLYEYVAGRIEDTNAWIAANARRLPRHVRGMMKLRQPSTRRLFWMPKRSGVLRCPLFSVILRMWASGTRPRSPSSATWSRWSRRISRRASPR